MATLMSNISKIILFMDLVNFFIFLVFTCIKYVISIEGPFIVLEVQKLTSIDIIEIIS